MNSFELRLNAVPHIIMEEILGYYKEYTESPSEFSNIFAPLLAVQDLPVVTFDLLPEEILEFYIFPYFNLHYWMFKLICVCKKWKRIYEKSTHPKQLSFRRPLNHELPRAMEIIKRYQPSTIQFEWKRDTPDPKRDPVAANDSEISIYSILSLVRASKQCNTLVIPYQILREGPQLFEHQKLTQITTLCVCDGDLHCSEYFPNLQKLHIIYSNRSMDPIMVPRVKNLAISKVPDYNRLCGTLNTVLYTLHNLPSCIPPDKDILAIFKDYPYRQYLVSSTFTKLAHLIRRGRFGDARKMLESGETSLQLEMELSRVEKQKHDYNFSFRPGKGHDKMTSALDIDSFYETEIARDFYNQLGTCCMRVTAEVRLNLLCRFGTADEFIQALKDLQMERMSKKASVAFFQILLHKDITPVMDADNNLCSHVKKIVHFNVARLFSFCKDTQTLDKFCYLLDWKKTIPYFSNQRVVKEVYEYGIRLAIKHEASTVLQSKLFSEYLFRFLSTFNTWTLVDEIKQVNGDIVDNLLNIEARNPQQVNKNVYFALLHLYDYDANKIAIKFFKIFPSSIEELCDTFKINWNHVIESQNTSPFLDLKRFQPTDFQKHFMGLLKCGVDPRKVPANTETVLSVVINQKSLSFTTKIQLIDALLAFDVDINEPSLNPADGTKHTPLSLAIIAKQSDILLDFMKCRGALSDVELMVH